MSTNSVLNAGSLEEMISPLRKEDDEFFYDKSEGIYLLDIDAPHGRYYSNFDGTRFDSAYIDLGGYLDNLLDNYIVPALNILRENNVSSDNPLVKEFSGKFNTIARKITEHESSYFDEDEPLTVYYTDDDPEDLLNDYYELLSNIREKIDSIANEYSEYLK